MIEITLLDALLFAAVAAIICLTSREFDLHNLAAGAWLILGGWLAYCIGSGILQGSTLIKPWALFLFLPIALVQILSPFFLAKALRRGSVAYLFVSLGIALIISSIAITLLISTPGAAIPVNLSSSRRYFIITAVFCIAATGITFGTSWWARLVFRHRLEPLSAKTTAAKCCLIAGQIGLLLAVGATGYFLHRGLFGTSEYRTVIPVLAVVLCKARPLLAAAASATLILFSRFLEAALPICANEGNATSLLALACVVAVTKTSSIFTGESLSHVSERPEQSVVKDPGLLALLTLVLVSSCVAGLLQTHIHQRFMMVCTLILASWVAQEFLGVGSVMWPALGATMVYGFANLVTLNMSIVASVLLVLITGAVTFALYLYLLRRLSTEYALLIDLSVLVGLYEFVSKSIRLSGSSNITILSLPPSPVWFAWSTQLLLVMFVLSFLVIGLRTREGRARCFGLANFKLGWSHDTRPLRTFVAVGFGLATIVGISSLSHFSAQLAITPRELSLENGIVVLLFGYLGRLVGLAMSFASFAIFSIVVDHALAGLGNLALVGLGIALIAIAWFASSILEPHESI